MANQYCNLDGTKKIQDEFGKINTGFDGVEEDIGDKSALNTSNKSNLVAAVNSHLADGVHQKVSVTDTDNATSPVDAPLTSAGGAGLAKDLYVGGETITLGGRNLIWCDTKTGMTNGKQWRIRMRISWRVQTLLKVSFVGTNTSSTSIEAFFEKILRVKLITLSSLSVGQETLYIGGFATDDTDIIAVGTDNQVDLIIKTLTAHTTNATVKIDAIGAAYLPEIIESVIEDIT